MLCELFDKCNTLKLTSQRIDFLFSPDVFQENSSKFMFLINKIPNSSMSYCGPLVKMTFRLHFLFAYYYGTHHKRLRPKCVKRFDGHKYFDSFVK